MRLRKEHWMAIVSGVMTVAFFFSLLWGYSQAQQNQRMLAHLESEYQRAYYRYLEDLREMAATTGKIQSASALQRAMLLGELSMQARSASDNLGTLPVQQSHYTQSTAFVNQIGDYALSLANQVARGEEITAEDTENLRAIYAKLQEIHEVMLEMERGVDEGEISFASLHLDDNWWTTLRRSLGGARAVQGEAAAYADRSANGYFTRANALLDGVEALEYQGRFSSHMDLREARGLQDGAETSAEECARIAEQFLSYMGVTGLECGEGEAIAVNSAIPLYSFLFTLPEGGPAVAASASMDDLSETPDGAESALALPDLGDIYITVSQQGGQVISFFAEGAAGEAGIEPDKALSQVEEVLKAAGYAHMKLVSREREGDELFLKYVHYQDEIAYYPDSVVIKVALDTGRITGLNAHDYWLNHAERELPETLSDVAEAIATMGEGALVEASGLAYISNGAGGEILCHEIRHSVNEEQYLTYIGAESMQEEQVMRSFESEDGSFYVK